MTPTSKETVLQHVHDSLELNQLNIDCVKMMDKCTKLQEIFKTYCALMPLLSSTKRREYRIQIDTAAQDLQKHVIQTIGKMETLANTAATYETKYPHDSILSASIPTIARGSKLLDAIREKKFIPSLPERRLPTIQKYLLIADAMSQAT